MTNETPQPNANIRRQSCTKIMVFIDFSGEGAAPAARKVVHSLLAPARKIG
jgi:hypothetical protein